MRLELSTKLRDSRLKQLSGRDEVETRFLHCNPFTYVPRFKMIFLTNEKPEIDGTDDGVVRRLRYIIFRNKFVDNPIELNERKIDRPLKDEAKNEIEYWLAFFQILLDYYNELTNVNKGCLEIPQSIKNKPLNSLRRMIPSRNS